MEGRVIRVSGRESLVEAEGKIWPCTVRGRLKAGARKATVPAVIGDRVEILVGEEEGVIERVLPRRSWLSRLASGRRPFEQVIAANIDRLFVVVAVRHPPLHPGFIDRALIAAQRGHVRPALCFNKIDLAQDEHHREVARVYAGLGCEIFFTSARTGEGLDALRQALKGEVSALIGQSGVGKSSLLNRIDPEWSIRTGEMMQRHDRGRHTTTAGRLYALAEGYVADTPGIKEFHPWNIRANEVAACFPEMTPWVNDCRFRDCTHIHEPGCAVLDAVARGAIASFRYEGYRRIRESLEQWLKDSPSTP